MPADETTRHSTSEVTITMQRTAIMIALSLLLSASLTCADAPSAVTATDALKTLMAGNDRFVRGQLASVTPQEVAQRRAELAQGQKPLAIVLCCSDSRVGPEIVFDQELGNIFVVRTAGEVLDAAGIGSIEYAVAHLGSSLLLVLGHEKCGAVAAAVADAKEPGHIADIVKAIRPAVAQTKGQPGDPLSNAVRANALDIAAQLPKRSKIISEKVKAGKLSVKAATLSLMTGQVELIRFEAVEWRLTEISGQPVKISEGEKPSVIQFDAATKVAAGYGGCNSFSGSYELNGTALRFGPIATTRRYCAGAPGDLETKFLQALGQTHTWQIREGRLLLLDGETVLAKFAVP
jgi:carbonic anhydrase